MRFRPPAGEAILAPASLASRMPRPRGSAAERTAMRILQLLDIPWHSGLAHYALSLAVALRDAGHETWIGAVAGSGPWDAAKAAGLPRVPHARLSSLPALRAFLRRARIGVVNAHTGDTHTLAVAAAAGLAVVVVRTRSDARPVRRRPGASLLFRRTGRTIAGAEYIRRQYLDTMGLPADRVVTILQGVPLPEWGPRPAGSPRVAIVGRLDPVKGHADFLTAAALVLGRHPGTRFTIAGRPEKIARFELQRQADDLGLGNAVDITGHLGDLAALHRECDIGVVASIGSEAVSRATLEWLAAGRPVVATRVGGIPELVDDGRTGFLVPPRDPAAMAEAISALLASEERRRIMGDAARADAEARFSLPGFAAQTARTYEEAGCLA
jgi:glycosyltransferase involved in cell wall biosynthesis